MEERHVDTWKRHMSETHVEVDNDKHYFDLNYLFFSLYKY